MKAKTLFINIIIIIVLLGIIELVCRAVLARIYNRSFDSSLIEEHKYGSSDGLKANANGIVWGQHFTTDELGGRKTFGNTGKKKRLYIGDSVTEGVGVDDTSNFAYRASAIDTAYNVRNISLIGYSTADYVNVINHYVEADSTVGSIAVFYCLNDIYGKAATKDLPVMAKQNLLGKINGLLQNDYATYKLLKLLVYQNSNGYYRYDSQFYTEDNAMLKQAMADIKTCDSLCKAKGLKFELFLLPYRSQLHDNGDRTPQQKVTAFSKQNNIACTDISPALASYGKPKELYLFTDEIHFSAKGHQKIAEYLQTIDF
jgi:lysophospholipase L1-like esterase